MRRLLPAVVLLVASPLGLAACGDGRASRVASIAQTASAATTTTGAGTGGGGGPAATTPAAPAGGLARRSPRALLRASADALARVRSYHVESTQTDDDGNSRISADVTADGRFRGRMRIGRQIIDVIAVGGATYLRANRAYWEEIAGTGAHHLGLLVDRWVKAPSSTTAGLRDTLDKLAPDHVARCMRKGATARGVVNEGRRTFQGRPVVVLRDPGTQPGSSPSTLSLSAVGPPLTVRETQTGPRVPGGHLDRECDDADSTVQRGESVFSAYDRPVRIVPPPNALDLDRLARSSDLTPA